MIDGTKYYEMSYLLTPTLSHDEALSAEEELKILLGQHEANLESWDGPKRRTLSYPINDHSEAYLGALRFTAPRARANELQESLKSRKQILRFSFLGWKKTPPRRRLVILKPPAPKELVPTDEKALNERLEEILGTSYESQ